MLSKHLLQMPAQAEYSSMHANTLLCATDQQINMLKSMTCHETNGTIRQVTHSPQSRWLSLPCMHAERPACITSYTKQPPCRLPSTNSQRNSMLLLIIILPAGGSLAANQRQPTHWQIPCFVKNFMIVKRLKLKMHMELLIVRILSQLSGWLCAHCCA